MLSQEGLFPDTANHAAGLAHPCTNPVLSPFGEMTRNSTNLAGQSLLPVSGLSKSMQEPVTGATFVVDRVPAVEVVILVPD